MAATRKLQGEIDRCLKKVSEGVETFEDIWQKVHNATNTNQKEKYEADLKKEIKKLQRLRDQIKSWIASGEIKDKSTLVDTRKLIETQMERFKVVERETKTKAYSKEGLGAAQKLDPTTREREDLNNWLVTSIDALQIQMDQFECEIESILAAKKKRLDKDKQDRLDELKVSLERHRFHSTKLETLMRMLDNLSMDVNAICLRQFLNQVKKIKDDVDYYLESNQEPEFEENEFLYDDIEGLEDFDDSLVVGLGGVGGSEEGVGTPPSTTSGNNSPISPVHSSDCSDPEKRRKSSDDSCKVVRPVAMKANHSPIPGVKSVVGTPPKSVGTPNNSSPSSGLSNHVSSLSSLSSSPTHNYHNALNNVKSLTLGDSVEHNNSSASGTSVTGVLSKSPSTNSTSITGSSEGMMSSTTVNGVFENGSSSEDHSSPHTQLISSCTPSSLIVGSMTSSGLENGLISPPPLTQETTSSNNQHFNSTIGSSIERSHHHQLFADSSELTLNSSSQQQQNPTSYIQQTLDGFAAAVAAGGATAGISNNLSDSPGFASNVSNVFGVSSSSLISNSSGSGSGNNNSSSVVLGGSSSNVIGLTSIVGGGNQNSAAPSVGNNSNSVSSLVSNATTTPNLGALGVSASYPNSTSNSSSNSLISASGGNGVSSHNNSNSGILSQQQIQQLQQYQQHGPTSQSGNSRDTTPISDYLRLHQPQDQMLLNRILNENDSMASLKSMAQDVLDRSGLSLGDHNLLEKTREAHIPPLLGVAPLGPVPLQKEHQYQFQMLDSAHCHLPVSADSERMRQFLPRNPYPTPHYYPQTPLTNSDSLEFFQRLSIETLFFIFYYLEGTKAQYMAAKVLKKQSWRFHTKYMMWFQRHEEPKVINEEFEQGTYIYFDIEKWSQRKKDGFVFEYRFLEDRDLG